MSPGAEHILEAFEALSPAERGVVVRELLRRTALSEHEAPTDEEFLAAADEIFGELDRRESQE